MTSKKRNRHERPTDGVFFDNAGLAHLGSVEVMPPGIPHPWAPPHSTNLNNPPTALLSSHIRKPRNPTRQASTPPPFFLSSYIPSPQLLFNSARGTKNTDIWMQQSVGFSHRGLTKVEENIKALLVDCLW